MDMDRVKQDYNADEEDLRKFRFEDLTEHAG